MTQRRVGIDQFLQKVVSEAAIATESQCRRTIKLLNMKIETCSKVLRDSMQTVDELTPWKALPVA